jgi:hypothetical protein
MKELTITFETLVERIGFELAVCVCDRDLDEEFWRVITDEQKRPLLQCALGRIHTPRWGFDCDEGAASGRIGSTIIDKFATTFEDWYSAYRQTRCCEGNEVLIKTAVFKLKELAKDFNDWEKVHDSCPELRKLALSHLDKLAQTPAEHCKVIGAGSNRTMRKVRKTLDEICKERGVEQIAPPEACNIGKEIKPVTELEKRHWREVVKSGITWREIFTLMCHAKASDHPLSSKALRESDAHLRDERKPSRPIE